MQVIRHRPPSVRSPVIDRGVVRLGLVVSTASAVGAGAVRTWTDVPTAAVVGCVVAVAGALSWRST